MNRILAAVLLLIAITSPFASAGDAPQEADLPKILIIGDSISIGYTPYVAQMLKGEAVVKHHKGNAGTTGNGLRNIEAWLGDTKWDVIHFNWGLHDLCYRHPDSKIYGNRDKVNGKLSTTLEQYEKNLDQLLTRLKKTGATLIWANTTVVPSGEAGRKVGDDKKYNEVADKVMKKHEIAVHDLCSLTKSFPSELFLRPGDVHYTKDGYKKIAGQVAATIQTSLKGEQPDGAVTQETATNAAP